MPLPKCRAPAAQMISSWRPAAACGAQVYIESVLALQKASGAQQPLQLAIMTSDDTHARTEALLQEHRHFGMASDQVTLLKQEKVRAFWCDEHKQHAAAAALAARQFTLLVSPLPGNGASNQRTCRAGPCRAVAGCCRSHCVGGQSCRQLDRAAGAEAAAAPCAFKLPHAVSHAAARKHTQVRRWPAWRMEMRGWHWTRSPGGRCRPSRTATATCTLCCTGVRRNPCKHRQAIADSVLTWRRAPLRCGGAGKPTCGLAAACSDSLGVGRLQAAAAQSARRAQRPEHSMHADQGWQSAGRRQACAGSPSSRTPTASSSVACLLRWVRSRSLWALPGPACCAGCAPACCAAG